MKGTYWNLQNFKGADSLITLVFLCVEKSPDLSKS